MEENKEIETLEEKKKGNKGLIVVIVLLLLICCGMGGFIFMNKDKIFSTKSEPEAGDKEKKEEKEPVVTVFEVDDAKISKLIDNLIVGFECNRLEVYTNDNKVSASDISNDIAYEVAVYNQDSNLSKDSVSTDEITKLVQKYFGKDYKFDPETLTDRKGQCISHYYDKASKQFAYQETACGGTCGPHTTYKIVKAVDTDGVLKLDVKVIFVDQNITNFYSDYAKTNIIGGFDNDVESYFNQGSDYQFTFKNEDDNYAFVSAEPIK